MYVYMDYFKNGIIVISVVNHLQLFASDYLLPSNLLTDTSSCFNHIKQVLFVHC